MDFKSFTLEQYRGIDKAITISIDKKSNKPYCLIGNNESGKTTILKGINLIGELCKGKELSEADLNKQRPKKTYFNETIKLSAVIKITQEEIDFLKGQGKEETTKQIQENNNELIITFSFVFDKSSYQKDKSRTILKLKDGQQEIKKPLNLLDIIKDNAPTIIYYDDFNFSVPESIQFTKSKKDENTETDASLKNTSNLCWQRIFNDLLKGCNEKTSDFQTDIIDWVDEHEGDEDAVNQRILALNNHLNKLVGKDWEDVNGGNSTFKKFEITLKNSNQENPSLVEFVLSAIASDGTFYLNERSKGCQWFFCFKIFTDVRMHRDNKGIIFLLDEPASNLHIHPQSKILGSLEKLSKNEKINVIYSTHVPFLINLENNKNIFITKNSSNDSNASTEISCKKLSDYDSTKNNEKELAPLESKICIDFNEKIKENNKKKNPLKLKELLNNFLSKTPPILKNIFYISSIIKDNAL